MKFSEQVRHDLRVAMTGIKQKDVAKHMKVSDAFISQLLNDKKNLTIRTVDRMYEAIEACK